MCIQQIKYQILNKKGMLPEDSVVERTPRNTGISAFMEDHFTLF